jgi:ABC-type multidrug transport system fused ATPase/permease subunit
VSSSTAVVNSPTDRAAEAREIASATPELSNAQLLRWMFQFLRPVKGMTIVCCCILATAVGTEILASRQAGDAVNVIKNKLTSTGVELGFRQWIISADPGAAELRFTVGALAALVATLTFLRYLRVTMEMKLSMTMVYYLREAVYDKLQRLGFGFHDSISSGQLINRALSDLQHVRAFVQTAVLTSLEIVLTVGGYIALICFINPWLALLSLVPLPIWTWYILRFGKKVQPAAKAVMEAEDRNVSIITENIAGVHVVKAFATEKIEIDKYSKNCDEYFTRVIKRITMFANFQPVIRLIAMGSHLTLFFAVAVLVIRGNLSAGHFLILGAAMGSILGKLQQVAAINEQYQNAIVSARRLYEVLAAKPTVPESPIAQPLPPGNGTVTFENVSFGYDEEKPVIKDANFTIEGGKVVAIVGPTGSGKSTLVNLLARFYDPQAGRILIDGMDVRDSTLSSLRKQVTFVFQETYLFSQRVAENISYGRPGVTHGEIEAAARLAQAHEFIEQLPKGYNTILAERGSSLSGGQKQRLAIARAIVSNPRILVLDDATAAIDPETEDLIRRAMKFVMYGRTTFVIAHRISTVKRADVVIVLEGGRVTQMGTHDQLMEQDGHYRHIAAVQLYGDDEEMPKPAEDSPSHMKRVKDQAKVSLEKNIATAASVPPPTASEISEEKV